MKIVRSFSAAVLFLVCFLSSVNTVFCQQNPAPKDIEPDTCSICLEDFNTGAPVTTLLCPGTRAFQSRHRFHSTCINESFRHNFECPNCRCQNPVILTDEVVAEQVKERFDRLIESSKNREKCLVIAALSGGALLVYGFYQGAVSIPSIPFSRFAACASGAFEHCTVEELCALHEQAAACLELCRDGVLDYCTQDELCSIWGDCLCSFEDLRGCPQLFFNGLAAGGKMLGSFVEFLYQVSG
jgi:Ring finger domain